MSPRDLFVVVPDLDAENVVRAILMHRQISLGARLSFDAQPYPKGDLLRFAGRDAGCRKNSVELLRPIQSKYRHALLMFDLHGSGAEGQSRASVEREIEQSLEENGWEPGRA